MRRARNRPPAMVNSVETRSNSISFSTTPQERSQSPEALWKGNGGSSTPASPVNMGLPVKTGLNPPFTSTHASGTNADSPVPADKFSTEKDVEADIAKIMTLTSDTERELYGKSDCVMKFGRVYHRCVQFILNTLFFKYWVMYVFLVFNVLTFMLLLSFITYSVFILCDRERQKEDSFLWIGMASISFSILIIAFAPNMIEYMNRIRRDCFRQPFWFTMFHRKVIVQFLLSILPKQGVWFDPFLFFLFLPSFVTSY